MSDEFDSGLLMGIFVGAVSAILLALCLFDLGRDECEKDLPRNQQCERVWVVEDVKP